MDSFSAKKLLTNSPVEKGPSPSSHINYWLAPNYKDEAEFVLSLGCEQTVNLVELVNTHNGFARDRATKELKVFIQPSYGAWQEVLHTTLEDSRQQADPLPLQTFPIKESKAKYVKFQQISKYGSIGGGLQYFAVKHNQNIGKSWLNFHHW